MSLYLSLLFCPSLCHSLSLSLPPLSGCLKNLIALTSTSTSVNPNCAHFSKQTVSIKCILLPVEQQHQQPLPKAIVTTLSPLPSALPTYATEPQRLQRMQSAQSPPLAAAVLILLLWPCSLGHFVELIKQQRQLLLLLLMPASTAMATQLKMRQALS